MLTKIEIITRSTKLDDLLRALNRIGVMGITVSQVFGCGLSKGHQEIYRGKKYDVKLVPKIKVETVVSEIPVPTVLATCESVLRTGKFGDGKIFVTELKDAVRIHRSARRRRHPGYSGGEKRKHQCLSSLCSIHKTIRQKARCFYPASLLAIYFVTDQTISLAPAGIFICLL